MKMVAITDNTDTCTGLRLAGIQGVVLNTREEMQEQLSKVLEDKDTAILVVTELLATQFSDLLDEIRLNRMIPLVVEIPDRHGTGRNPEFLTEYIRTAIGVKL